MQGALKQPSLFSFVNKKQGSEQKTDYKMAKVTCELLRNLRGHCERLSCHPKNSRQATESCCSSHLNHQGRFAHVRPDSSLRP